MEVIVVFYKKQHAMLLLGLFLSYFPAFSMNPQTPGDAQPRAELPEQHPAPLQNRPLRTRAEAVLHYLQNSPYASRVIPAAITAGVLTYAQGSNHAIEAIRRHALGATTCYLLLSQGVKLISTIQQSRHAQSVIRCAECHQLSTQTNPTMVIPCIHKHTAYYHPACLNKFLEEHNTTCPACHRHIQHRSAPLRHLPVF
jgi:hypothetical protein